MATFESAFKTTLQKIEKDFGAGSAMVMANRDSNPCPVYPSGIAGIDGITGIGGFPLGRMIEIYGSPSCGKTTLAVHIVAEMLKNHPNKAAAYLDVEQSLDLSYVNALGIDPSRLMVSQPSSAEETVSIAAACLEEDMGDGTSPFGIIVIDSVAAMIPEAEIAAEPGELQMGLQARLMGQACRKLSPIVNKKNSLLIWINQTRDKIGVSYGSPTVTTGGNALKFYTSMRLEAHIIGQIKGGDSVVGNRIKLKMAKNKLAPPFKVAEYDLIFGQGICKYLNVLDMATDKDIVKRSGAWYSVEIGGETVKLGCGRENAKSYLIENPETFEWMKAKLYAGPAQGTGQALRGIQGSAQKTEEA